MPTCWPSVDMKLWLQCLHGYYELNKSMQTYHTSCRPHTGMNRFRGVQIKSIELVESGPSKIQDAAIQQNLCGHVYIIMHVHILHIYNYLPSNIYVLLYTYILEYTYMHRFWFGTFEFTNIPCQPCLARKACRTCGEALAGYVPACRCLLAAGVGVVGLLWTFLEDSCAEFAQALRSLWYPNLDLFIVIENIGVD